MYQSTFNLDCSITAIPCHDPESVYNFYRQLNIFDSKDLDNYKSIRNCPFDVTICNSCRKYPEACNRAPINETQCPDYVERSI